MRLIGPVVMNICGVDGFEGRRMDLVVWQDVIFDLLLKGKAV